MDEALRKRARQSIEAFNRGIGTISAPDTLCSEEVLRLAAKCSLVLEDYEHHMMLVGESAEWFAGLWTAPATEFGYIPAPEATT